MKIEAVEERRERRRREADTINSTRWRVVCVTLYEGDLSHADAVLEVASARHTCDCGGAHEVLPETE